MAIKELALITEKNRRKKKKEETPTISKPTKEVVKNKKGTTHINRSTISTKPTVEKSTQNRVLTNKERLTSKPTINNANSSIKTVKSTVKAKSKPRYETKTFDIYERGGRYYYQDGKKEKEIDQNFVQDAIKNKRKGVIGSYDSKGNLRTANEKGNVKAKEKNILKKAERVAKGAWVGTQKGFASIADAAMQETRNDLQKGEKIDNYKDLTKNEIKALAHSLNPFASRQAASKEAQKNIKKIWKDENKNILQKITGTGLEAVQAGTMGDIYGLKESVRGLGAVDHKADEKVEKIQKKIDEPINKRIEKLEKEGERYDKLTNTLTKWNQIVGNMAPGIAASAVTKNPNLAIATMALGAKGQATERALAQGADLDTATKMGTAGAWIEAGTEKITGGAKIFGGGAIDDIFGNLINSKVKNKGLNFIAKQGYGLLGETFEEVLSDLAGVMIDKGTINPKAKYTLDDFLETAKDTFGSTFILNLLTGGYGGKAYNNNIQEMQNYENQINEIEQQRQAGQIEPKEANELLEEVKDGTYQQNRNLEQIASEQSQAIEQALQNGQISQADANQEYEALNNTLVSERERINQNQVETQAQSNETAQGNAITQETQNEAQNEQNKGTQESTFNNEQKQKQFDIIQNNNPMQNDVNTGIRNVEDIKTLEETLQDSDWAEYDEFNPDLTKKDIQDAIEKGTITVYSSYPIEQGIFVSPSKMEAESYSGDGKIYSKEVPIQDIAWIDPTQGQYAKVDNIPAKTSENVISEQTKPTENVQQTETQEVQNEPTQEETQQESKGPEILDKMPKEKNPTIKSVKKAIDSFRKEITDMFAPIYDLAYKKTGNKNLYYTADRILSSDGRAQVDLGTNQVDLNGKPYTNFTDEQGNKVAMGFETAYDLYGKIPDKAKNEFLVNQLNMDRLNQGVEQFEGITYQDSQNTINELKQQYPDIEKWSENIYQYYRNLQQKMVDNGRIPQELADEWQKTTPHYVHIQRQVNNQGNTGVSVKNGKVDSDNLIRKVKGGDYAILPIKDTTAKFTQNASRAFAFNDFGKEYARTIGTDARGENVDNNTNIDEIFGFEPEFVNTDGKGTYTLKIYENGMPVEIPISEDVYNALSPKTIPRVGVLAEATNLYKDLLTNKNPFFGFLRNPIKDAGDMFLYSKHPLRKSLATYGKLFTGRTALKDRVMTKDGVTAQDIVDLYHNTGNAVHSIYKNGQFESNKGNIRKGMDKALSPIEKGNDFMESMPRITEFWNTIQAEGYTIKDGELVAQKGKTPKKTPSQVIAEASYNAADVTVNFKRGGRTSKAISQNGGIFFNPSVQGASKFVRNVTEAYSDAKSGDLTAAKRLVLRAAGLGVAPALLSAAMYGDDDDYKDIQDYQKDQYYLIKAGDGKWIRIPKGRAISLFESATRRGIDKAQGGKFGAKDYGQLVLNQIAPNNPLDNNILSPITSAITNKSWSGNKIVSDSMAKRPVEEQFNEKTDELSKKLGKQLGISPMKINYVIDQYSGVLGDLILPQITPRSSNGSSNPVINILKDNYSFDAANSNKSVGNFYETKNKLQTKARGTNATDKDKLQSKYLGTKAQDMYALYTKKQEIQMDKNLSKKEKYEQALEVQKEINKMAKKATENAKDIKIGKNTATVGNALYYKGTDGDWHKESEKTTEKRKELGLSPEKYYYYKNEESFTTPDGYTKSIVGGKNAKRNVAIVDAFNFDTSDYLEYTYKLSQIKGKKNSKGYTIRGTRQPKVLKYINSLPISAAQKAYLYKTQYSSYKGYDGQFVNTIEKSNLSSKEKQEIYSYLKLGR